MKLVRPPIFPTLFLILGLGILFSLGTWQVGRYFEKIVMDSSCTTHFSETGRCDPPDLTGKLLSGPIIPVQPRLHDGRPGYHIYLPFQIENTETNPVIFVNLGWSDTKIPQISNETVSLRGRVLSVKGRNIFSILPEPANNDWYAFDFSDINTAFEQNKETVGWKDGLALYATKAVYEENKANVMQPFVPPPVKASTLTPATHIQYAAFWFSMALAFMIIFVLRFMRLKN